MSGYSGYVANNPEPNLSPCLKPDTQNKNTFDLFID